MVKRYVAEISVCALFCGLTACVPLTTMSTESSRVAVVDSNGLDERARNGFHVQNVRMVLAALVDIERQDISQTDASRSLHELLYSELYLLNGFDPNTPPKSEHKGLCGWRPHIALAQNQLKALVVTVAVETKRHQLERTEKLLESVCAKVAR